MAPALLASSAPAWGGEVLFCSLKLFGKQAEWFERNVLVMFWRVLAGPMILLVHPSPTYSAPLQNENPGHGIHGCSKVKTALG